MSDTGKVNIHGKEYKTVAYRIAEFREQYGDSLGVSTDIVAIDDAVVVVKAMIAGDGFVLATGHAEENRDNSQINKTSALENCETSAIGRALAVLGFAGTEFASADEVATAITQQSRGEKTRSSEMSDKQLSYIESLVEQLQLSQDEADKRLTWIREHPTKNNASALIEKLKIQLEAKPKAKTGAGAEPEEMTFSVDDELPF